MAASLVSIGLGMLSDKALSIAWLASIRFEVYEVVCYSRGEGARVSVVHLCQVISQVMLLHVLVPTLFL